MLQWTLGYTFLFQFWFPWCVCPEVGLLGHKAEAIKLLEENIGKTLSDIHHSRILYVWSACFYLPPPNFSIYFLPFSYCIIAGCCKLNKWIFDIWVVAIFSHLLFAPWLCVFVFLFKTFVWSTLQICSLYLLHLMSCFERFSLFQRIKVNLYS